MIFQGIRTSISQKRYIFVIFQGGGGRTVRTSFTLHPFDPHMGSEVTLASSSFSTWYLGTFRIGNLLLFCNQLNMSLGILALALLYRGTRTCYNLLRLHYAFYAMFALPLCASIYMCLVVTCWERAYLLALVCGV